MSRVTQYCISASASGPVTSNLRKGERSITTHFSRAAQYSSMGPSLLKRVGSQYPRYSVKFRVSAEKRSWKAVCLVSSASASGVMR